MRVIIEVEHDTELRSLENLLLGVPASKVRVEKPGRESTRQTPLRTLLRFAEKHPLKVKRLASVRPVHR